MFKSILFKGVPFSPMYNADGVGGAGGTGTGEPTGGEPTQGGSGNPTNNQPFAVFPDADSFNARMSREAKKLMKAQLKELGFEDVDTLKSTLETYKTSVGELDTVKGTLKTLEDTHKTALQQANEKLMQYEVKLLAKDMGIIDPDVAYALMDKSSIKATENGSFEGIKESLENLVSDKKYLLGNTTVVSGATGDFSGGSGSETTLTMEAIKNMSQDEVAKRLPEITAFLNSQK